MSQAFHGGQLAAARREFGRDTFLDFSSNLNVFWPGIAEPQWEALREEAERYPEPDAASLRERLAELGGIDPRFVLPTSGAAEALYLAARLFAGRRVAILEPAFADYHRAFVATGNEPARLVGPASLAPYEVIVLGNPNNPTGAFRPRAALLETIDAQPKTWIVDEAFIEFVPQPQRESLLTALAERPNVIVLRSLTKSWRIPGLRLGFLATSNAAWLARLAQMQPPWSVNAVAQAWARGALTRANHAAMLASLAPLPDIRAEFAAGLAALGPHVHPSAANFLLVEIAGAAEAYRALGREGFLVRRGDSFYGLAPADAHLRLAVRRPAENRQLLAALAPVCA